ncbi:MAG: hypothetical protein CL853_07440 [Crocinitomicaceae bacterium]|nr:hypothetical protein [Crocinitomicaceae bacterium]
MNLTSTNKYFKSVVLTSILFFIVFVKSASSSPTLTHSVDSILNNMSLDEKIGQLFMIPAYSNMGQEHEKSIEELIKNYHVGGILFFQGSPYHQVNLTNRFQTISKSPLLIAIDAECGLAMRLDSTILFPRQMTLGAIQDNNLIYQMGKQIGVQCKEMGIHMNMAPVVDINNNPKNPVINHRSFGENPKNVTAKSLMYMKGLHEQKILANAKHFPGHGDTDSDSHKTLPTIYHDKRRLDSVELYPFKVLIDSGLKSTMVAHLYVPAIDSTPNKASTLSRKLVTELLQDELKFKGLIFTDGLNMRGVSAFYEKGEVDVQALLAGNDILLIPEDIPKAVEKIKQAINDKRISIKDIEHKVKKILSAKKWLNLSSKPIIENTGITQKINSYQAGFINHELYKNALTLIKNENTLPITRLDTLKIASVSIGKSTTHAFNSSINRYCSFDKFFINKNTNRTKIDSIAKQLNQYNTIILSIYEMNQNPYQNFGLPKVIDQLCMQLSANKKIILNLFGNPYSLSKLKSLSNLDAVLISYEDQELPNDLSGQLIFGGISAKGKLPISINSEFKEGFGLETPKTRFSYTYPESIGVSSNNLLKIDTIVEEAFKAMAFPGCQIFAAKDGEVFFQKSYGNHTYDKDSKKVDNSAIYDLASITKIASSAAALMDLHQKEEISLDSNLGYYLPNLVDTTEYSNIVLKEMLTHQAKLTPWIPFYIKTLFKGKPKYEIYSIKESDYFNKRVANNLFINDSYRDTIFDRILSTNLLKVKKYKYSDVGYYFVNQMIKDFTGLNQDQYVDSNFYSRLGLKNIGYQPRNKWPLEKITPTENDKVFRQQLIHGDVHDQGAAMLGGVAGHAGLFSNANDLAVMMQLFMQYGIYGQDTLLSEETVKLFTSSPYYQSNKNRRGIAFDKPVRNGAGGPTCFNCASTKSFGHSGFTGTLAWADPENGFVYVFLSNRVHPNAENKKLITMNIRTRIQKVFIEAINKIEDH